MYIIAKVRGRDFKLYKIINNNYLINFLFTFKISLFLYRFTLS